MASDATTEPLPSRALTDAERLDLANRLYRECYVRCFWHCPRELVITEALLPMVIAGLRKHGGREGFIVSGKLRRRPSSADTGAGESAACR